MSEKKNLDDFLQSIVIPQLFHCSVGKVDFEGNIVYQKLLSKKNAIDWYIMSFEEKTFLASVKYNICD